MSISFFLDRDRSDRGRWTSMLWRGVDTGDAVSVRADGGAAARVMCGWMADVVAAW